MIEQSWKDDPLMMKFLSTTNNRDKNDNDQQIIDESFKILEEFKEEQA
jgi:hypothetical protein